MHQPALGILYGIAAELLLLMWSFYISPEMTELARKVYSSHQSGVLWHK